MSTLYQNFNFMPREVLNIARATLQLLPTEYARVTLGSGTVNFTQNDTNNGATYSPAFPCLSINQRAVAAGSLFLAVGTGNLSPSNVSDVNFPAPITLSGTFVASSQQTNIGTTFQVLVSGSWVTVVSTFSSINSTTTTVANVSAVRFLNSSGFSSGGSLKYIQFISDVTTAAPTYYYTPKGALISGGGASVFVERYNEFTGNQG